MCRQSCENPDLPHSQRLQVICSYFNVNCSGRITPETCAECRAQKLKLWYQTWYDTINVRLILSNWNIFFFSAERPRIHLWTIYVNYSIKCEVILLAAVALLLVSQNGLYLIVICTDLMPCISSPVFVVCWRTNAFTSWSDWSVWFDSLPYCLCLSSSKLT